ncbi:MAG: UPF0147 family protein [Nitrosarchaeum sp.]
MTDDKQNKEAMKEAIETLNQIATNRSTPKTIKKSITDLVVDLNNDEYSLSVRANNTISLLDDVTQDPNMPSYVRTQLWQAVSKLESIRE